MPIKKIQAEDGTIEVLREDGDGPLAGPLRHERSIVWLKNISNIPFVRVHIAKGCKNRRGPMAISGGAVMVGYATLRRDAQPTSAGGTYTRRLFYVTKADVQNPRVAPHGAVDPLSILPGEYGNDFTSAKFERVAQQETVADSGVLDAAPTNTPKRRLPMAQDLAADAKRAKAPEPSATPAPTNQKTKSIEGLGFLNPTGGGDPVPLVRHKLVIGRKEVADIVLRFKNVSSVHCNLYIDEGYWFVEDHGSTNGTKVNGVRLAPNVRKRLDPGDRLSVAKHHYDIEYCPEDLGAIGTPPPDGGAEAAMPEKSLLERIGI